MTLRGLPVVDEVIVVSEGPAGDTMAAVRAARPDALVIRPGRSGAGNALASGLAASSGDVVVTLNGDGSTDPGEIPRYVAALTGGADIALGSRYRDGGRDLTGGRFRRWANLALIWVVNTLFGSHRTDPGFGYAAFWRDALARLDLPDPSSRHGAAWGDGPEIGPLLAVRPEARGLRVTEVGSVAYPRMRRPARSERPGVRHWIRVLAGEYAQHSGRHTAEAAAGEALVRPLRPSRREISRRETSRQEISRHGISRHETGAASEPARTSTADLAGATSTADLAAATWATADRQGGQPIWAPHRRRPIPVTDLWRDGGNGTPHLSARDNENPKPRAWRSGHPERFGGPDVKPRSETKPRPDANPRPEKAPRSDAKPRTGSTPFSDVKPRSVEDNRPDPAAARVVPPQSHREVGAKRRRLQGFRQRPDLRLINGEGTGTRRTGSGRLRPVPRENPSA